jgi:hypothetical protein
MFELQCEAAIENVTIKAKVGKIGTVMKRCRIKLSREFDALIARAIGGDALDFLESVSSGAVEKVVMPIDAVVAEGTLRALGGEQVTIKALYGVKATATAPKEDEDPPLIRMDFDFGYDGEVWRFLGDHAGAVASVTITPAQLEIPGTKESAVDRAARAFVDSLPKGTKVTATVAGKSFEMGVGGGDPDDDEDEQDDDDLDPQDAATPEEAERIREERLQREAAEALVADAEGDALPEAGTKRGLVVPMNGPRPRRHGKAS